MQIVFVVTTDNSNIDKPPMYTVFNNWSDVSGHCKWHGFNEVLKLDLLDDVISSKGLKFSRETEKGHTISIAIKTGIFKNRSMTSNK